jgi:hypothetical protein
VSLAAVSHSNRRSGGTLIWPPGGSGELHRTCRTPRIQQLHRAARPRTRVQGRRRAFRTVYRPRAASGAPRARGRSAWRRTSAARRANINAARGTYKHARPGRGVAQRHARRAYQAIERVSRGRARIVVPDRGCTGASSRVPSMPPPTRTASPHVCRRDQNEAYGRASYKEPVLNAFYTQMPSSGYKN